MPAGTSEDSDPFRVVSNAAGTLVVHADFEEPVRALGLLDRPAVEALLERSGQGGSRGRRATAAVALPGRSERVHLRPVRHGGLLAPLWGKRVMGLGRPLGELRVTETLRRRGAPVPRPVLVVGWRARPLWSALLGTLHVEGALDGLAWLRRGPDAARTAEAAAAAGRAVRDFHDAGGRHADLHLLNLLVEEGDPLRVRVIDLDRARVGDPPSPRRRMRELARLYRSLLKRGVFEQVGRGGRAAFFAAYTEGSPTLADALRAHWPREKRRIRWHVRGYRQPG